MPIAQPLQLLKALLAEYPQAPPAARRSWIALANRMPPFLLEQGHRKLRELRSCTRLRCPRAVWYRWAVDQLSELGPGLVPACSRRHIRGWASHWREKRPDPVPLSPVVAQLVADATPLVSRPAPAVPQVTAPAPGRPQLHTDAWLVAQARDMQELAFVRRYVERRRQLSQQGAPCRAS